MPDHDFSLSWESVHMRGGHAGFRTTYLARTHQVCYRSQYIRRILPLLPFCRTRTEEKFLDIPPQITGREEIIAYVKAHRPYWIRERHF